MEEMRREMDSMLGSFGMRDPFASFPLAWTDPFAADEDLTPNVSPSQQGKPYCLKLTLWIC